MSQALVSPANCCSPCADTPTTQIPGPSGAAGANGTNGTDGQNSFTELSDPFIVPDAATPDIAKVVNSDWAVVGQIVFLEGAGYFSVVSVPDSTHIELDNTDYAGNSADGTVIPVGSLIGPGGLRGVAGAAGAGSGDMLGAVNLAVGAGGVANAATARTNLGLGTSAIVDTGVGNTKIVKVDVVAGLTNGDPMFATAAGAETKTAAAARTALGLAIGTNVQAYDADLTTWAGVTPSANALTLVAAANYAAMLVLLGKVLPRYGLLGSAAAVDMNLPNNDNSIAITATTYRIDKVVVVGLGNLLAATSGVFTAAGGGGTTLALDQALAAVTASGKFLDMTKEAVVGTDVQTASPLRFRTGTAAGAAVTANVFIFGWDLS